MVVLVSLAVFLLSVLAAHSAEYTFVPVVVPFPGARETTVTGLATDGTMIGTYVDAQWHTQGFVWLQGGPVETLPLRQPRGISPDGTLIAGFFAENNAFQGFLRQNGTFTTLHGPVAPSPPAPDSPASAVAFGITPAGMVVGFYHQANTGPLVHHGFSYDPTTRQYATVDFPVAGAVSHGLVAIGATGALLGFVMDRNNVPRGVLKEGETLTLLEAPGVSTGTIPLGITDDGSIALSAGGRGVIYKDGVYTPVAMPGTTRTQPFGVRKDGVLYGQFRTPTARSGFLAYPPGVAVPARKE
jgi:hypothetical protein